mmetsp:Transcript_5118/g.7788  ORF Transcript_5118/g.7788 Transcript_5118/m.7788 type:complete len:166 (-) Transcript_5118:1124-1621(-)|eukprot:CAMPEP_0195309928 /NCGR_PEP_ID=MMETSP0707-20130614/38986_1 /TAXON_ID=33640 /ORGANISM="Asterionellopsis glacialis, Strain CCMP134" /LENGTH=165 /DNA_ID=CAMNT_0040374229 /DNA_START=71 /DNA_END=568 /DNA_ORIENTATION=+
MSNIHHGNTMQQHQKPGFTKAEIQELEDAFQLFDVEGRGKIKCSDLQETISTVGNGNQQGILNMLQQQQTNNNNNGELDFDQFLTVMTCSIGNHDGNDLRSIFDLFDHDKTGYITIDDLQIVASNLGETMSYDELQEMIDRANPKLPGKVSADEFYQIMTKKLFS